MRRTLTAAALLGVFIVAPAGAAFADPGTITGRAYGNCGVNAHFTGSDFGDVTLVKEGGSYAKQTQGMTQEARDIACRGGNSVPTLPPVGTVEGLPS